MAFSIILYSSFFMNFFESLSKTVFEGQHFPSKKERAILRNSETHYNSCFSCCKCEPYPEILWNNWQTDKLKAFTYVFKRKCDRMRVLRHAFEDRNMLGLRACNGHLMILEIFWLNWLENQPLYLGLNFHLSFVFKYWIVHIKKMTD